MKKVALFCFANLVAFHQVTLAAYTSEPQRGRSTQTFNVPGTNLVEECVIPKEMSGADYKKKDLEKLIELCSMDFWSSETVGICPKINSTNPGIDVHEIDTDETSKADFEKNECSEDDRSQKKVAKFKQSISCSYTPSILAYFHFSRLLEGARVKPAAIRTMSMAKHKDLFNKAAEIFEGKEDEFGVITQTWASFSRFYRDPAKYPQAVDSSLNFIYGAIQQNPRGEVKYTPINGGAGRDERYDKYKSNAVYELVTSSKKASDLVGPVINNDKLVQSGVQKLVVMKDMTDMILLDSILSQQDRLGNIAAQGKWYGLKKTKKGNWEIDEEDADIVYNKDTKSLEASTEDEEAKQTKNEMESKGFVFIAEMILKDNDCGIVKENRMKKFLAGLTHLSPKTYQRLLLLKNQIQEQSFQDYLKTELLFTADDVKTVKGNVEEAATLLQKKCKDGKLLLDLDLEDHLRGKGDKHIGNAESCELKV